MKRYLLLVVLLAAPAIAQDPFLVGEALDTAVREQCSAGCVVITREDAETIDTAVQALALRAYQAGVQAGRASCGVRSL